MNNPVRIFYLEDNPRDAELVRDKLQQIAMPHELRIARDRAEYEAALAQTRFDLILSDYSLPDYDGMTALALAREKQPDVPFILISGTLGEERAVDCVVRGATDYVLKQNINRLVPAVLRALTEAKEHQKRRVAEEALLKSEERNRVLIENSHDIIYTLTPDGVLDFVSPAWTTFLGHAAKQVTGFPLRSFIHPDDLAACEVFLKSVIETGQRKSGVEYRVKHSDGSWYWHSTSACPLKDVAGNVIGFEGVARDITEHKRADDALWQSRVILRAVLDNIPARVFWKDRDLNYLGCNVAFARDAGIEDPQQLVGKDDFAMGWSAEAERYRRDDREVIETGESRLLIEEPQTTPSGETIHLLTSKVALRDAQGAVTGVLGTYMDVSEMKRAEAEREKLQAQLVQAQKMESVGRLAGGVAHDFNNLLTVILGYTELALNRVEPAEPLHADLEEIRKAAHRSADLTRQLLAFARKQTIAPKVLDLNQTVAGMLKMLKRLIGEDINLDWKPGEGIWPVKMDPTQIDQILANLCVNARDAIAGIGMISVETHNTVLNEEYCAQQAGFTPGEHVLLTVSDDGCGMDSKTLLLLFEPFFTTKEVGKGTGLGLATVYGIVKQNNGFINVYSEPGQGTTFKIYLPRYAAEMEPLPKQAPVQATARGHETILLVEDEPAILKMTTIMLESQGYTVLTAKSPAKAIRLAGEHSGRIDLLLTDVVMPEMNGRYLAKNLLSICPSLKCLFMSGYTADIIAHRGMLDEGEHFIQKPFSLKDLRAKLREVLEG